MVSDISGDVRSGLLKFLKKSGDKDILGAYLYYLSLTHDLHPVLYTVKKTVYRDMEVAIDKINQHSPIWRNTKVSIQLGRDDVNAETKKVYICPFCGKAFGDNTHPSPQDAIYDWVANCPKNVSRKDGLPDKRFFVSEDPDIIEKYYKNREQKVLNKEVFSSTISLKIFGTKEALMDDFKKNYLKPISLVEVQRQNRFKMDDGLLKFVQDHLTEDKISEFIEKISNYPEFNEYVQQWV